MASRQTIIKEVKVLLKAGALPREFGVEEADFADLVNAALARYSKDRPLVSFADYAGDSEEDRTYTTAMCVLCLEVYYRYFTPLLQVK